MRSAGDNSYMTVDQSVYLENREPTWEDLFYGDEAAQAGEGLEESSDGCVSVFEDSYSEDVPNPAVGRGQSSFMTLPVCSEEAAENDNFSDVEEVYEITLPDELIYSECVPDEDISRSEWLSAEQPEQLRTMDLTRSISVSELRGLAQEEQGRPAINPELDRVWEREKAEYLNQALGSAVGMEDGAVEPDQDSADYARLVRIASLRSGAASLNERLTQGETVLRVLEVQRELRDRVARDQSMLNVAGNVPTNTYRAISNDDAEIAEIEDMIARQRRINEETRRLRDEALSRMELDILSIYGGNQVVLSDLDSSGRARIRRVMPEDHLATVGAAFFENGDWGRADQYFTQAIGNSPVVARRLRHEISALEARFNGASESGVESRMRGIGDRAREIWGELNSLGPAIDGSRRRYAELYGVEESEVDGLNPLQLQPVQVVREATVDEQNFGRVPERPPLPVVGRIIGRAPREMFYEAPPQNFAEDPYVPSPLLTDDDRVPVVVYDNDDSLQPELAEDGDSSGSVIHAVDPPPANTVAVTAPEFMPFSPEMQVPEGLVVETILPPQMIGTDDQIQEAHSALWALMTREALARGDEAAVERLITRRRERVREMIARGGVPLPTQHQELANLNVIMPYYNRHYGRLETTRSDEGEEATLAMMVQLQQDTDEVMTLASSMTEVPGDPMLETAAALFRGLNFVAAISSGNPLVGLAHMAAADHLARAYLKAAQCDRDGTITDDEIIAQLGQGEFATVRRVVTVFGDVVGSAAALPWRTATSLRRLAVIGMSYGHRVWRGLQQARNPQLFRPDGSINENVDVSDGWIGQAAAENAISRHLRDPRTAGFEFGVGGVAGVGCYALAIYLGANPVVGAVAGLSCYLLGATAVENVNAYLNRDLYSQVARTGLTNVTSEEAAMYHQLWWGTESLNAVTLTSMAGGGIYLVGRFGSGAYAIEADTALWMASEEGAQAFFTRGFGDRFARIYGPQMWEAAGSILSPGNGANPYVVWGRRAMIAGCAGRWYQDWSDNGRIDTLSGEVTRGVVTAEAGALAFMLVWPPAASNRALAGNLSSLIVRTGAYLYQLDNRLIRNIDWEHADVQWVDYTLPRGESDSVEEREFEAQYGVNTAVGWLGAVVFVSPWVWGRWPVIAANRGQQALFYTTTALAAADVAGLDFTPWDFDYVPDFDWRVNGVFGAASQATLTAWGGALATGLNPGGMVAYILPKVGHDIESQAMHGAFHFDPLAGDFDVVSRFSASRFLFYSMETFTRMSSTMLLVAGAAQARKVLFFQNILPRVGYPLLNPGIRSFATTGGARPFGDWEPRMSGVGLQRIAPRRVAFASGEVEVYPISGNQAISVRSGGRYILYDTAGEGENLSLVGRGRNIGQGRLAELEVIRIRGRGGGFFRPVPQWRAPIQLGGRDMAPSDVQDLRNAAGARSLEAGRLSLWRPRGWVANLRALRGEGLSPWLRSREVFEIEEQLARRGAVADPTPAADRWLVPRLSEPVVTPTIQIGARSSLHINGVSLNPSQAEALEARIVELEARAARGRLTVREGAELRRARFTRAELQAELRRLDLRANAGANRWEAPEGPRHVTVDELSALRGARRTEALEDMLDKGVSRVGDHFVNSGAPAITGPVVSRTFRIGVQESINVGGSAVTPGVRGVVRREIEELERVQTTTPAGLNEFQTRELTRLRRRLETIDREARRLGLRSDVGRNRWVAEGGPRDVTPEQYRSLRGSARVQAEEALRANSVEIRGDRFVGTNGNRARLSQGGVNQRGSLPPAPYRSGRVRAGSGGNRMVGRTRVGRNGRIPSARRVELGADGEPLRVETTAEASTHPVVRNWLRRHIVPINISAPTEVIPRLRLGGSEFTSWTAAADGRTALWVTNLGTPLYTTMLMSGAAFLGYFVFTGLSQGDYAHKTLNGMLQDFIGATTNWRIQFALEFDGVVSRFYAGLSGFGTVYLGNSVFKPYLDTVPGEPIFWELARQGRYRAAFNKLDNMFTTYNLFNLVSQFGWSSPGQRFSHIGQARAVSGFRDIFDCRWAAAVRNSLSCDDCRELPLGSRNMIGSTMEGATREGMIFDLAHMAGVFEYGMELVLNNRADDTERRMLIIFGGIIYSIVNSDRYRDRIPQRLRNLIRDNRAFFDPLRNVSGRLQSEEDFERFVTDVNFDRIRIQPLEIRLAIDPDSESLVSNLPDASVGVAAAVVADELDAGTDADTGADADTDAEVDTGADIGNDDNNEEESAVSR